MTNDLSNYELKRKLNMEKNQDLLRELGLNISKGIASEIPYFEKGTKRKQKLTYNRKVKVKAISRTSRRIRGQTPETVAEILDDDDRVKQLEIPERLDDDKKEDLPSLDDVHIPLCLRSIGTTVWSLGKLNTGKGRSKSWSSGACKYKHPYPIGYRAAKSHFGNDYVMGIDSGPEGEPVFTVQINSTIFTGKTPTAPWTEACIKSNSCNTRVSGPLFFGFSDSLIISLIKNMEGYEKTKLPENKI